MKRALFVAAAVLNVAGSAATEAPVPAAVGAPVAAALCSGCHASAASGSLVPTLAGHSADDIILAMAEYRGGTREGTIMGRIAKGFSDEETRAMAVWLAALPAQP